MKIFPAIDIKDKKCVRLVKGDFDKKTEYELSPIEQAGKFKDHGFKNLHIVDLDGALTGETVNLDIIQDIVGKFNLKVEVGGGIRNSDSIQKYIDADVVMFVYREGYYLERKEPRPATVEHAEWQAKMNDVSNLAEIIIGKQRHGPTGNVMLEFEAMFTKFKDRQNI